MPTNKYHDEHLLIILNDKLGVSDADLLKLSGKSKIEDITPKQLAEIIENKLQERANIDLDTIDQSKIDNLRKENATITAFVDEYLKERTIKNVTLTDRHKHFDENHFKEFSKELNEIESLNKNHKISTEALARAEATIMNQDGKINKEKVEAIDDLADELEGDDYSVDRPISETKKSSIQFDKETAVTIKSDIDVISDEVWREGDDINNPNLDKLERDKYEIKIKNPSAEEAKIKDLEKGALKSSPDAVREIARDLHEEQPRVEVSRNGEVFTQTTRERNNSYPSLKPGEEIDTRVWVFKDKDGKEIVIDGAVKLLVDKAVKLHNSNSADEDGKEQDLAIRESLEKMGVSYKVDAQNGTIKIENYGSFDPAVTNQQASLNSK